MKVKAKPSVDLGTKSRRHTDDRGRGGFKGCHFCQCWQHLLSYFLVNKECFYLPTTTKVTLGLKEK